MKFVYVFAANIVAHLARTNVLMPKSFRVQPTHLTRKGFSRCPRGRGRLDY